MLKKFIQDYFSYQLSHILGGRQYTNWADETLRLHSNIPLRNSLLAKELEEACKKQGFLSYYDFLTLEQFGKYGYHSTHKQHGMTDVKFRWPEALSALCQKKNIHHLVEFGPGDGVVGSLAVNIAHRRNFALFWSGVEINESLRQATKENFRRKQVQKNLLQLVPTLKHLQLTGPCLFVFSYSLDNLIPDVFINSSDHQGPPNAMMGVMVQDGLLSERILTHEEMQRIGCRLEKGIFYDQHGYTWDLQEWQLHSMQRVYLPLEACRTLLTVAKLIPVGSQILIIDEFRIPRKNPTYHLGVPRDLETFSRDMIDFANFYKTAGKNLLYFPSFAGSLTNFLKQLGFSLEEYEEEHRLAYQLSEKTFPYRTNPLPRTLALLTSKKKKNIIEKKFIIK